MPKVPNIRHKAFRKRFIKQSKDSSFRKWKKNRLDHQAGRCFYCHKYIELKGSHVEHLIPLWRGGTNQRSNLVISCAGCNLAKGVRLVSAKEILNKRQQINSVAKEDLKRIAKEEEQIADLLRNL